MLKIYQRSYTTIQQYYNYSRCFLITQHIANSQQQSVHITSSASCFHLRKQPLINSKHEISKFLVPDSLFQHVNIVQAYSSKGRGKNSKVFGENDEDVYSDSESDERWEDDNLGDEEVEDEDDLADGPRTWKDLALNVSSLRIDAILSSGLGISRKKIEDAFLEARLMLNNKVISKKSKMVKQGDVVDVVLKGKHSDNKDRELPSAAVMRVKVLRIREELTSKDRVPVKLRRWKHLEV
ncbi:uncharacterized protein [Apostichopus japonicus]